MGSAARAITDRVTKQIVTLFSKTCNKKVKTCPLRPIWSYRADMPGNATVAM